VPEITPSLLAREELDQVRQQEGLMEIILFLAQLLLLVAVVVVLAAALPLEKMAALVAGLVLILQQ
jgi:hypothetical protein